MVRRVAAFSSCGSTSSELSRPALSSAMRALLMSKPTTGNCLPNSTASGSPTKPRPITPILVLPISNIPNSLCKRTLLTPADGVIAEPFACLQRGIDQVTAIEDIGLLEQSLELMEVRAAEEIPFCADHERIGAFHGLKRHLAEHEVTALAVEAMRLLHRGRVVGLHMGTRRPQGLHEHTARRLAHVVGVGFEREAPHGEGAACELTAEMAGDLLKQQVFLPLVDRLHRL